MLCHHSLVRKMVLWLGTDQISIGSEVNCEPRRLSGVVGFAGPLGSVAFRGQRLCQGQQHRDRMGFRSHSRRGCLAADGYGTLPHMGL